MTRWLSRTLRPFSTLLALGLIALAGLAYVALVTRRSPNRLAEAAPALCMWVVFILTALVGVLRDAAHKCRAARVRDNVCVKCGYDLRASRGRCPECGTTTSPLERP